MTDFKDRFVIDGKRMDADVAGRILSAVQTRTVEGASSLVLRLDDRDRAILRSGVLTAPLKPSKKQQEIEAVDQAAWDKFAPARAVLDGWFVRLAGVSFEDESGVLTVTFEDEIATLMRRQTKAHKSTRHDKKKSDFGTTRAGFIHTLLFLSVYKTDHGRVLGTNTATSRWFSPEEDADQSAKEPAKDVVRSKGLPKYAKLTIKGEDIDPAQRKNLTAALGVADEELASDLAVTAMLCAGIGESSFRAVMNGAGSDYGGVFQGLVRSGSNGPARFELNDTEGMARCFLKGGKGFQAGGAIHLAKSNPDMDPGEIAIRVEGAISNFPSLAAATHFYGQWRKEAEKILDTWGGVSQIVNTRRKYSFRAGGMRQHEQHNYWDDAGDLAREVNWRLFADQNILFYVSDNWLFGRQATITVDPDDAAVTGVSFDADIGKPIAEVIVQASSPRWTGAPGAAVQVTKMGPINGKWLLHEHVHDLYTGDDTYTLQRPSPKFKEPAPDVRSRTVEADDPITGAARDRIVKVALKAYALDQKYDKYQYLQVRPVPPSLFGKGKIITDCSGFATLVYKAAGIKDPNGGDYQRSELMYTGSLLANGTKTNDPKPGDLVFYASPEHVGVFIGGGQVVEFGGNPGPLKIGTHYRSDILGFYTYDLSDRA